MDVWVEIPLDGQKQDMSCSDIFIPWMLHCLLQVFVAVSPMMIHQIKRMILVIMIKELIHLQIYKIWGEQIKNISCWFVSRRYHGHVLKMVAGIFNEIVLRIWRRRWCQTLSLDNTGHQANSQREHDQKDHKQGSSRPRRGLKTHLE